MQGNEEKQEELTPAVALQNIKQLVENTVVTNAQGLRLIDDWFKTVQDGLKPEKIVTPKE